MNDELTKVASSLDVVASEAKSAITTHELDETKHKDDKAFCAYLANARFRVKCYDLWLTDDVPETPPMFRSAPCMTQSS